VKLSANFDSNIINASTTIGSSDVSGDPMLMEEEESKAPSSTPVASRDVRRSESAFRRCVWDLALAKLGGEYVAFTRLPY
jgi:hypothetical protein